MDISQEIILCGINQDLLCGNVDINPDSKALCDIEKKNASPVPLYCSYTSHSIQSVRNLRPSCSFF